MFVSERSRMRRATPRFRHLLKSLQTTTTTLALSVRSRERETAASGSGFLVLFVPTSLPKDSVICVRTRHPVTGEPEPQPQTRRRPVCACSRLPDPEGPRFRWRRPRDGPRWSSL